MLPFSFLSLELLYVSFVFNIVSFFVRIPHDCLLPSPSCRDIQTPPIKQGNDDLHSSDEDVIFPPHSFDPRPNIDRSF